MAEMGAKHAPMCMLFYATASSPSQAALHRPKSGRRSKLQSLEKETMTLSGSKRVGWE
jgi:hypothetical protein